MVVERDLVRQVLSEAEGPFGSWDDCELDQGRGVLGEPSCYGVARFVVGNCLPFKLTLWHLPLDSSDDPFSGLFEVPDGHLFSIPPSSDDCSLVADIHDIGS